MQTGGTVDLEDDIILTDPITVSTDTTVNLNGYTVEATLSSALFNVNGARLTLRGNGTIQHNKWIANVTNNGRLTIDNGTYVTDDEAFIASNGGMIIFNNGYISAIKCAFNVSGDATVEINGGLIEVSDGIGIATKRAEGYGDNMITINGGKIDVSIETSGYEAAGVFIANDDMFAMTDGEIVANGGTGLCMRAGDVVIHGGTITATNVSKVNETVPDGKIGDSNRTMTGCSAIIYDEAADYPAKSGMMLTIDGGTITGVDHSIEILSNEQTPQVFVTGGTFTPVYPEGS